VRKIIVAAIAALTLGMASSAYAQTTTGTTSSGATATAIGGGTTVVMPNGAGGAFGTGAVAVPTGIGGAQWVMGQTTGGNNVTSYDACLKNAQLTVLFAAVAVPLEISHCWELRDMDAMAKFPPGSIQYEHGCRDSSWLNTDWETGTMKCTANQKKLAKSNPNDPRAQRFVATPVVAAGMNVAPMQSPPPTVVPVAPTMSEAPAPTVYQARDLPRCKGPNDQSRCAG
jgi:hypothetical protein